MKMKKEAKTMNKTEMIEAIDELPKFKKREVAVLNHIPESLIHPDPVWIKDKYHFAITEEDSVVVLTFVSGRYKVIQMAELFKPIIEKMDVEVEGRLRYNEGFAIMDIFPQHETYKIGEAQIGICAYNSVDKTSALNIKFSIRSENRTFVMPNKSAAFRKVHVGKIAEQTKDYIEFIDKIKEMWVGVSERLMKKTIPTEDFDAALTAMGENPKDKVWKTKKWYLYQNQKDPSVWEVIKLVYDQIEKTKFKSDIHKRKHLDNLSNIVFDYDFILKLG